MLQNVLIIFCHCLAVNECSGFFIHCSGISTSQETIISLALSCTIPGVISYCQKWETWSERWKGGKESKKKKKTSLVSPLQKSNDFLLEENQRLHEMSAPLKNVSCFFNVRHFYPCNLKAKNEWNVGNEGHMTASKEQSKDGECVSGYVRPGWAFSGRPLRQSVCQMKSL